MKSSEGSPSHTSADGFCLWVRIPAGAIGWTIYRDPGGFPEGYLGFLATEYVALDQKKASQENQVGTAPSFMTYLKATALINTPTQIQREVT